ncbi:protein HIRA-like isoform X2 [Mya arenaria]|uniref:protein HIRA-like isoform X2 n=1 Tax=Mya arenaria TaxID=6604 RepID=UPI0022E4273B|nr:protein HIRA-like isoform X2 [Mya arenaria]
MRLVKPAWVNHKDGKPIFSVDIHPDGSRFATGGQGDDAGKIIIWNMAPVRSESAEKDDSVPKVLCEMDNHLACVNCVRWSGSGRYLASCGDDKLIMIWHISKFGAGGSVFGSDSKIIESWRPAHTLRGHAGEQVSVLRGHTGLVKGVTWDPVGKYLASQSDDRSLRVWRTRDWQQEAIVTEPFKECGGTTHVLRCDWSPDGHYVVSAHAMNNSGPTAQIIERAGWKTSLDFVGHRKAITVVRFNPGILCKKFKKDASKAQQYTCCAIGSRDRSLSIWLTALKRPLVVTHELFTNSILDITWASCGSELLCCSCDGTVAYIQFKPEEIGTPMSKADTLHLLEKIYGKAVHKTSSSGGASQIIESADLLRLQQQQQQNMSILSSTSLVTSPEERSRLSNTSNSTPTKSSIIYRGKDITGSPFKPTDKQIETKTPDGRRRITPIFIPSEPEVGAAPEPFTGNTGSKIQFKTSKGGTSIQIERKNVVTLSGLMSPPATSPVRPGTLESTPKSNSSISPVTAGGDKSIDAVVQPLSALDNQKDASKAPDTPKSSNLHKISSSAEKKGLSLKRKHDKDEPPRKRGRPRLADKDRSQPATTTPFTTPSLPAQSGQAAVERPVARHLTSAPEILIPVPATEKRLSVQVLADSGEGALTVTVENNVPSGGVMLSRLCVARGGDPIWQQVLSTPATAVAGSRTITAVSCTNCCLSVYNEIGQKALPNLMLSSKVSILDVHGCHVLAVTCTGALYLWNVQKKQCIIKNEQLSGIIKREERVKKAVLSTECVPVVTLSSHRSFTFSPDLASWLLVQDRSDRVSQSSSHYHTKPRLTSKHAGTLTALHITQERHGGTERLVQSAADTRQLCTLSHLESQLQACLALQSPAEYRFWLHTYVRYLVQEGLESQLREVCSGLLGPIIKTSSKHTWEHSILGIKKRTLLKEVLPLFSENLKALQRLYTEFQEQLDMAPDTT